MKKILILVLSVLVLSCSKEKDGKEAEETALEKFFAPYGDTCFVNYEGIYLYLTNEGNGEYKKGDPLVIYYSGKTLENVVTFANQEVIRTTYPGSGFIEGWNIALKHIKKGSEGMLVVPYKKGFGKERTGIIEPFSTLVYAFKTE